MTGTSMITIRIPARNIAQTMKVEDNLNMSSLFDTVAEEYFLNKKYHYFTFAENGGPPIPNNKTVKELRDERKAVICIAASPTAPLYARVPFLNDDELKKAAKKVRTKKTEIGPDSGGRTLLHLAAEFSFPLLKVLIRKHLGDVNAVDIYGNTPLMFAAQSGNIDSVQCLITAGASVQCTNTRGENPLHFIAKNGNVTLQQCASVIEFFATFNLNSYSCDNSHNTPAHTAMRYANNVVLEYFVTQQYFQLETANLDGDTCLHLAVKSRDEWRVRTILELGGPKYVVNKEGEFPLDIAHRMKLDSIAQELGRDLETNLIIRVWESIKANDLELCKYLNVRYRDRVAAAEAEQAGIQSPSSGKGLKRAGSIYSTVSGTGKRGFKATNLFEGLPYHKIVNMAALWAAARFHLEILDYLLDEAAINFNFQNSDGSFLLYILCQNNPKVNTELYLNILKKCCAKGAHLNDRNINENCCLHIAALTGNTVAVKFLLDNGAFPNSINCQGLSELHFAILNIPNLEIINELVKAGADYSYKLKNGLTVSDFAQRYGSADAYSVLSSRCVSEQQNTSAIQPNVAIIKVSRGENLLAGKEENGLCDPFCILSHRLADLHTRVETMIKYETLNPVWDETFSFVVRLENIFYRDITIDVFDWDNPVEGELQVNNFIGSTLLVLDPRDTETDVCLELRDQEGKVGNLYLNIEYKQILEDEMKKVVEANYVPFSAVATVKTMLKNFNTQSVGEAKAVAGYTPQYPIMIIPGLASSALEAWETPKSAWLRERVWVDPFKIGHTAIGMKLTSVLQSKKKKKKEPKPRRRNRKKGGNDEDDVEDLNADQRVWLRHILCAADGFSDPPGIKVRPCSGLAAVDFLSVNPLARKATYVFGHVIQELANVGYTSCNLDAAPYDWRLPPEKLETRDYYFTTLAARIKLMREFNKERVVLMAHSMGNRTVQYFLKWATANEELGQKWIDENIHAFFALGPPFLGATKTVRAVVSGDCMGLDVFLTPEEGRTMARGSGSLPWLFPIQEDLFPDIVSHIRDESSPSDTAKPFKSSISADLDVITESYTEMDVEKIVKLASPLSWDYFTNFYLENEFYMKQQAGVPPPVTEPPPVENLWVLYGVNLDTEVSYYFKKHKKIEGRYCLDAEADKFSNQKIAGINPRGLRISGGMGFETKNTFQPSARANKSGDGTVPYCSLNYGSYWEELANEGDIPLKNVRHVEIEGADHREMLNHPAIFEAIINFVCRKTR